ncbi:MAG: hypothetical protein ACKOXO_07055 [Cyanobium sp.]
MPSAGLLSLPWAPYPLHAITNDGACLCHRCCASDRLSIATTTGRDGWTVIAPAVIGAGDQWQPSARLLQKLREVPSATERDALTNARLGQGLLPDAGVGLAVYGDTRKTSG